MGREKDKSKSVNKSTQPSDTSNIKTKGKQSKNTTDKNEKKMKVKENKTTGKHSEKPNEKACKGK